MRDILDTTKQKEGLIPIHAMSRGRGVHRTKT